MVEYPTSIVTDDGWGVIFQGHGLALAEILAGLDPEPSQGVPEVREVHMAFVPRVKHCSKYDGWGCDQEGEWHSHWFATKPGVGTEFTIVHQTFPARVRAALDGGR